MADGRVSKQAFGTMSDRLGAITEETPASALTDRGHGELMKGVHMDKSTPSKREIALDYLRRVADDLNRAARLRIIYAQNARSHKATNQEIAEALGVTESAVRRMLTRHGDA